MENFIQINSISGYGHIADNYLVEDISYEPRVFNTNTGKFLKLGIHNRSGFGMYWHVKTKDNRHTTVELSKVREAYDERHRFK